MNSARIDEVPSDPTLVNVQSASDRNVRCLYCEGTEFTDLYQNIHDRLGVAAGEWAFNRCCNCGSGLLSPLPKQDDIAGYYPEVYSFAPDLAKNSRLKRWISELEYRCVYSPMYDGDVRRIIRNTGGPHPRGKRVLDVGCGRGLRLRGFLRYDVVGCDFQPEIVDYVNNELGIPAVFTGTDDLCHSFAEQSFDIVTAYYVLEHVLDVKLLLHDCWRLLKPGGWFAGRYTAA